MSQKTYKWTPELPEDVEAAVSRIRRQMLDNLYEANNPEDGAAAAVVTQLGDCPIAFWDALDLSPGGIIRQTDATVTVTQPDPAAIRAEAASEERARILAKLEKLKPARLWFDEQIGAERMLQRVLAAVREDDGAVAK